MMAATLDTHRVVKRLRAAGFTDEQAETMTDVLRETQDMALAEVVTKGDLKAEFTTLRAEIANVRTELVGLDDRTNATLESLEQRMSSRSESLEQRMNAGFESLEQRMSARFESLEQRMNARFESLEQRMTIKLGAMLAAAVGLVALLVKLL